MHTSSMAGWLAVGMMEIPLLIRAHLISSLPTRHKQSKRARPGRTGASAACHLPWLVTRPRCRKSPSAGIDRLSCLAPRSSWYTGPIIASNPKTQSTPSYDECRCSSLQHDLVWSIFPLFLLPWDKKTDSYIDLGN